MFGLNREEYHVLKDYIPNYKLNLINPAEIEDLTGLKTYVEQNREYFSDIDEETYQAAKMMLGADSYWKDIKSEKENGGMDMCKALEDLRQEGINVGVERGIERGFIEALQEVGMTYEETMEKLQEKFELTEEMAEQKMKDYWEMKNHEFK